MDTEATSSSHNRNNSDGYCRRSFLRQGLGLAGVAFASNFLEGLASGQATQASEPKTAEKALAELKAGNQRYVTGTHLRLASAEYGAAVLGATLIVVLGHSECGAIKSTIDVITKNKELPGHLPQLISYLKPPVQQALSQGGSLDAAIQQNVVTNVGKLQTAEPVIAPLVKEKKVEVVGALYDLSTGRVKFLS